MVDIHTCEVEITLVPFDTWCGDWSVKNMQLLLMSICFRKMENNNITMQYVLV
jgi:hypothetical protein